MSVQPTQGAWAGKTEMFNGPESFLWQILLDDQSTLVLLP